MEQKWIQRETTSSTVHWLSKANGPANADLHIDVLFDVQQVIGHCLQGQLMENRWDGIKATINNQ